MTEEQIGLKNPSEAGKQEKVMDEFMGMLNDQSNIYDLLLGVWKKGKGAAAVSKKKKSKSP